MTPQAVGDRVERKWWQCRGGFLFGTHDFQAQPREDVDFKNGHGMWVTRYVCSRCNKWEVFSTNVHY